MSHPSERELVLSLLGDADDRARVEGHLRACAGCRQQLEEIRELLAATEQLVVPEPDAGFEERIWQGWQARQRLRPIVGGGQFPTRRWLGIGALAASLLLAFAIGLFTPTPGSDPSPATRDRLLLVAVGEHLESARMVLVELANNEDPAAVDLASQRLRAERLLGDNRIYRQTAALQGDAGMSELLGELERVLLEVARSSGDAPGESLAWLRERLEGGDLIFKVRVLEGRARRAEAQRSGA